MSRLVLVAFFSLISVPCHAGKVYRCPDGSYQDKPCGDGGVVITHNRPQASVAPAHPCASVAREAEAIAEGRQRLMPLSEVLDGIERGQGDYESKVAKKKLVVDVYGMPGSPQEVAVIFETNCLAEHKRRAAALAAGQGGPAGGDAAQRWRAEREAEREAAKVAERQRRCDDAKSELADVRAAQRRRGSAAEMEHLNEQKRKLDKAVWEDCGG